MKNSAPLGLIIDEVLNPVHSKATSLVLSVKLQTTFLEWAGYYLVQDQLNRISVF